MKACLEEMDERINKRLDTVEDSIEQIQTNNNAPNQTSKYILARVIIQISYAHPTFRSRH